MTRPTPGAGQLRPGPSAAPSGPASRGGQPRRHRGLGAVADGRGLTAIGVVLALALLGGIGVALDLSTGRQLGIVFAALFIGGCVVATLAAHREDLLACVVSPPLVYVALMLISGSLSSQGRSGSLVSRQALELVNELILGAPVLLAGTGAALVLAALRALGRRRSR